MAETSKWRVLEEYGEGVARIETVENTRGYKSYRPRKIYLWNKEYIRGDKFSMTELKELYHVIGQFLGEMVAKPVSEGAAV